MAFLIRPIIETIKAIAILKNKSQGWVKNLASKIFPAIIAKIKGAIIQAESLVKTTKALSQFMF